MLKMHQSDESQVTCFRCTNQMDPWSHDLFAPIRWIPGHMLYCTWTNQMDPWPCVLSVPIRWIPCHVCYVYQSDWSIPGHMTNMDPRSRIYGHLSHRSNVKTQLVYFNTVVSVTKSLIMYIFVCRRSSGAWLWTKTRLTPGLSWASSASFPSSSRLVPNLLLLTM